MSNKPETSDQDPSKIAGNASMQIKEYMSTLLDVLSARTISRGFAHNIGRSLSLTEVSFLKNVEEPGRMEGRVVVELTVDGGKTFSPNL